MSGGQRLAAFVGVGLLCLGLAGCGAAEGKRVAVHGEVTLDGQPLPKGMIYFVPPPGHLGAKAGAVITAGRYEIAAEQGPGLGKMLVEIYADRQVNYPLDDVNTGKAYLNQTPPPDLLPPQYNEQTTLSAVIIAEGPNKFDFPLKR